MNKKLFSIIITLISIVYLTINILNLSSITATATGSTENKSCGGVSTSIIECEDGKSGIGQILKIILNILTICIGILAVIGITVVGIQYLTAGANEEQTRKAKRRLIEIVIGIIAYILLYALLQWLIPGSTNPDDIPYYEPVETPSSSNSNYGGSGGNSGGDSSNTTDTKQCTAKTDKEFIADKKGKIEGYFINIPKGSTEKTPIVFYLPGDRETTSYASDAKDRLAGSQMIDSTKAMFNNSSFISVILYGPGTSNGGWMSQSSELASLAKGQWGKIENEFLKNCGGIGSRKKYIMGMSNGAQGLWTVVNANPTLFDGAAPVSGYTSGAKAENFNHTKIVGAVGTNGSGYENTSRASMGELIGNLDTNARLIVYLGATHNTITESINYEKLFGCLINNNCSGSFDGKRPAIVYNSNSSGPWQTWCSENIVSKYGGTCTW